MNRRDGRKGHSVRFLLISLILTNFSLLGCARHDGMARSEEPASPDQHLPFDRESDNGGIFPTGSLTPEAIPAGTPLAIRLRSSLSSATSQPGDSFEAVLDEAIVVRGKVIAPRGTSVRGKVLDAKAASELQESGYIRLALTAVVLNRQSIPIQTSSIFMKRSSHHRQTSTMVPGTPVGGVQIVGASTAKIPTGSASIDRVSTESVVGGGRPALIGASTMAPVTLERQWDDSRDVGVSAERRLTFRLAQPLPLGM